MCLLLHRWDFQSEGGSCFSFFVLIQKNKPLFGKNLTKRKFRERIPTLVGEVYSL